MARFVFTKALQKLATAGLGDLSAVTVKVVLVTSSYTPTQSSDEFYSAISSYVLGTPIALSSKTVAVNGTGIVFDAADVTFTGIASGTATALVFYIDTGTESTSPLIGYDSTATNLPFTFTGTDVTLVLSSSGVITLTSS